MDVTKDIALLTILADVPDPRRVISTMRSLFDILLTPLRASIALDHREPFAKNARCNFYRGHEPNSREFGTRVDGAVASRGSVQIATRHFSACESARKTKARELVFRPCGTLFVRKKPSKLTRSAWLLLEAIARRDIILRYIPGT